MLQSLHTTGRAGIEVGLHHRIVAASDSKPPFLESTISADDSTIRSVVATCVNTISVPAVPTYSHKHTSSERSASQVRDPGVSLIVMEDGRGIPAANSSPGNRDTSDKKSSRKRDRKDDHGRNRSSRVRSRHRSDSHSHRSSTERGKTGSGHRDSGSGHRHRSKRLRLRPPGLRFRSQRFRLRSRRLRPSGSGPTEQNPNTGILTPVIKS
jgi:hypothetical protein